ncbi:hypothetical protein FVR03_17775 [Pontibacter qinzhouensis]|uniref:Response receiver domain-containing protein n=1 Tax=Pontibacter qinzhouensis TaxID=2603253 RepID=A0A5C8JFG5_9BACT|nr:response regulator receiver domain [Pontibacter qinzhouensis]TXK36459.1 hypothetical protein FVR03_17775 [Pontibacter qinzhouensis]
MTPSSPSFEQASRKIVTDFLHSVVVVDDRASLNDEVNISNSYTPKDVALKAPSTRAKKVQTIVETTLQQNEHSEGVEEGAPNKDGDNTNNRDLKAKILIDTFAEIGLVCAVLKPVDKDERLESQTDHATQKSDIVILDWQISESETSPGETALRLIKKIIKTDSKDRLRLIAIYTTSQDLHGITEKVSDVIKTPSETASIDGFEITRGPIKVVIYQKSGGTTTIAEHRVVDEANLPEKLINDFTSLTKGLLSNVALKSLGALRENTHRIISKFNSGLDAPYVAHRILTNPSEEAETHPIPLLTSEFNEILEDCNVCDEVSIDSIKIWLNHLEDVSIIKDDKLEGISSTQLKELIGILLEKGLEKERTKGTPSNWRDLLKALYRSEKVRLSELTVLLSKDEEQGAEKDLDFAVLTTMRSHYSNISPSLKLGSIIKEMDGTIQRYLICLQPLCDSVRVTKERKFPFLPLVEASSESPNDFEIVLQIDGDYKKFKVKLNPYLLELIPFKPHAGDKEIKATLDSNNIFSLKDSAEMKQYRWVGELKFPQAQRIVNKFGSQISRVGLTESDWLRRMATAANQND